MLLWCGVGWGLMTVAYPQRDLLWLSFVFGLCNCLLFWELGLAMEHSGMCEIDSACCVLVVFCICLLAGKQRECVRFRGSTI